MQQRYVDKVALVTGGGSGMGEAFCHRFAAEGGRVAVLDIAEANGERVAADIRSKGADAHFIRADVTDSTSMEQAVAATLRVYGTLDVAVNNAGIGGGLHAITEFPVDAWVRAIHVNLIGVFMSMRAEIPAMRERGGSIINLASTASILARPNTSAYIASKHGVVGLTKAGAAEGGPLGIRVNAVGPTFVRTPMTLSAWTDEASWRELDALHPLGRCATAEEIANVVAFLGSDEASIITGSLYMADGGCTLG